MPSTMRAFLASLDIHGTPSLHVCVARSLSSSGRWEWDGGLGPLLRERYHSACNLQGYKANGQQVRQGEEAARSASGPLQMNGVGGGSAVGAAPTSSAGLQLQLQQHGKPQQAQGGQQQQQELPDSLSSLKSLAEAALPLSSHMGLMQQNHSSELPPGYLDLSGGLQVN